MLVPVIKINKYVGEGSLEFFGTGSTNCDQVVLNPSLQLVFYPRNTQLAVLMFSLELTIGPVPPSILSPRPSSAELAERAIKAESEEKAYNALLHQGIDLVG